MAERGSPLTGRLNTARRIRPTDYAALGFIIAAAGFAALSAFTKIATAWTPNLGASCLSIAATIAIVDRIVRSERDRQLAPMRRNVIERLVDPIFWLFLTAAYELAGNSTPPRPLSTSTAQIVEELRDPDMVLFETAADGLLETADSLDFIVTRDRPLMPYGLAVALDELALILREAGRVDQEPYWVAATLAAALQGFADAHHREGVDVVLTMCDLRLAEFASRFNHRQPSGHRPDA